MYSHEIEKHLLRHFALIPTSDQQRAINHISRFQTTVKQNPAYVLKGYAGTGKTSILGAYVKTLVQTGQKFVLMAPTGRAAKVLSAYTGRTAHTIHRYIYFIVTASNGVPRVTLGKNKMHNTVFIVDEASMISDSSINNEGGFASRSLLDDLIEFIYSASGNKLILVGDTAQLPPVGLNISPALDFEYLKGSYNLTTYSFEMKEVMRQSLDSGILYSATLLREKISKQDSSLPMLKLDAFKTDVQIISDGNDFEEILQQIFYDTTESRGVLICRTNKRANIFNEQIRIGVMQRESEIDSGDTLMVVKNNYFWLDKTSKAGFIANGEMFEIMRLIKIEDIYGFRFAEAEIRLLDYPEEQVLTVKLLLDTIMADGPGLTNENKNLLFENILEDYPEIPQRRKRVAKVMTNPYFNALHVKFAYALTCHKTQGGQWPTVIIDQGWLADEMINTEYLRWLYTAFTRATNKLYLINFREDFLG